MILTTKTAIDGDVLLAGGVFPVAAIVTAVTTASAANYPKMNPAPLRTPFFDDTIRMKMVSAIGYSAMANPMRMRSMIIGLGEPKATALRPCPDRAGRGYRPAGGLGFERRSPGSACPLG